MEDFSGSESSADAPSTTIGTPANPGMAERSCFICLLTESEDPTAVWVDACPCSLDAHESCMLQWVEGVEAQGSTAKTMRCTACRAPIQVVEPRDKLLAMHDHIKRLYGTVSPIVLLTFVLGGVSTSSSAYGVASSMVFAGPAATAKFLALGSFFSDRRGNIPLWRWKPFWVTSARLFGLSFVAPGLVFARVFPGLSRSVLLPWSMMYTMFLIARDDVPSWPPTGPWATTLMPCVATAYSVLYYQYFGGLEKRLDRALQPHLGDGLDGDNANVNNMQRNNANDDQDLQQRQQPQHRQAQQNVDGEAANGAEPTMWSSLQDLFRAVFANHEEEEGGGGRERLHLGDIEFQIEFGVGGDQAVDEEFAAQAQEALEDALQAAADAAAQADGEAIPEQPLAADVPANDQLAAQAAPPPDPVPAVNEGDQNGVLDNNANHGGGGRPTARDACSGLLTTLLYPSLAYAAGELLKAVLPASWVQPSPFMKNRIRTGLLQERWGRSLVGGAIVTVLQDAAALYIKYRRVQARKLRRIKNVDRKKLQADAAAGSRQE